MYQKNSFKSVKSTDQTNKATISVFFFCFFFWQNGCMKKNFNILEQYKSFSCKLVAAAGVEEFDLSSSVVPRGKWKGWYKVCQKDAVLHQFTNVGTIKLIQSCISYKTDMKKMYGIHSFVSLLWSSFLASSRLLNFIDSSCIK